MSNRNVWISVPLVLATISFVPVPQIQAQTFTFSNLYSITNDPKQPRVLNAAPVLDAAGNVYTVSSGGGDLDLGTVFRVTQSGALSVLYSFEGGAVDGRDPETSLARDKSGNLYGSTSLGGEVSGTAGVIFRVTPSGQEAVLHYFTDGSDGVAPSNVSLDLLGNVYGTAETNINGVGGLVFKIDANGIFQVLHDFCDSVNCVDGNLPIGKLVLDGSGNVYGVTAFGGTKGGGTVFKISPNGTESILHNFSGPDGSDPTTGLTRDGAGNLYGVTGTGGTHGFGTLFKLPTSGGKLTTLYNFCSQSKCNDGKMPIGPVRIDKAGNIFGVAPQGGAKGGPVVWEVNVAGQETIVHTFPAGVFITAGLGIDSAGNLYGCTSTGGSHNLGSVYKLTRTK